MLILSLDKSFYNDTPIHYHGYLQGYDDQFMIRDGSRCCFTQDPASSLQSHEDGIRVWGLQLRNTREKYSWKTSWGIRLRYTESWRWYLVEAARCMSARAMPYWRDIEKSCFILMAFLCIVNWPSAHIWGKGGRDATTHRPISSNSSGAPSSSSPWSALSSTLS